MNPDRERIGGKAGLLWALIFAIPIVINAVWAVVTAAAVVWDELL